MRVKTLVMSILSVLLVAVFSSGQARLLTRAKIPFAFSVTDKVLPAGEYEFTQDANSDFVAVRGTDGRASAVTAIMTRLARGIHTTPQDCHIVFDKVGDSATLSEIWVPDLDGFMLHLTKGKHEHRMLDIPK